MKTLVCSVITPTWNRHDYLFSRCIPSVRAQTWGAHHTVEHIIVSDGPDPELALRLAPDGPDGHRNCWYRELPEHNPDEETNYGHAARMMGIEYASGDLITYCDDDDALRPQHCSLLADALGADPEAGFAVSRMASHGPGGVATIGYGPLGCGNVGTPMIMHRREILEQGTWGPPSRFEDWELVEKWLNAGIKYVNVDAETSDVWPSIYR